MVQSSLVGHWPLHEWSGRANDISGNDNHGTLNGGVTQGVAGRSGLTAYSFDGSNDYVEVSDNNSLQPSEMSISVWVNFSSFDNDFQLLVDRQEETSQGGYRLIGNRLPDDNITFSVSDSGSGTNVSIPGSKIQKNIWHHIVGTLKDGTSKIFLDNSLIDSTSGASLSYNSTESLVLGARQDGGAYDLFFNGNMANVRLYNRELSVSEIDHLYQVGSADVATPPGASDASAVSRWSFYDRSDTSTALDEWGSNDGTINGNTYTNNSIRGLAIEQDTNGDYIDTGFQGVSTPLTISAWANIDSDDDSIHPIFGNYNGTPDDFSIRVDMRSGQNGHEAFFDNGTSINVSGTASIGAYDHIVYTVDSNESKLYKNGAVIGSAGGVSTTVDNGNNFRIGGDHNSRSFIGQLDDIRYYDRKLSDYEVQQLYQWGTRGVDRRHEVLRQ